MAPAASNNVGLNLGPLSQNEWIPPLHLMAKQVVRNYANDVEEHAEGDLRFTISTKHRSYRTQLIVHEDERLVVLLVYTDFTYLSSLAPRVLSLSAALSRELVVGSFVFDSETGAVIYRSSAFMDTPMSEPAIERLLNTAEWPLNLWNAVTGVVNDQAVSVEQAVSLALLETGLTPKANLKKRTLRHIIGLVE